MCKHDCSGFRMSVLDLRRCVCLSSGGKCNERCSSIGWTFLSEHISTLALFLFRSPLSRVVEDTCIVLHAMFIAQVRGWTVFLRLNFYFEFFFDQGSISTVYSYFVFVPRGNPQREVLRAIVVMILLLVLVPLCVGDLLHA